MVLVFLQRAFALYVLAQQKTFDKHVYYAMGFAVGHMYVVLSGISNEQSHAIRLHLDYVTAIGRST